MTDRFAQLRGALSSAYELEHEIGRGGMATVWLARDLRHRRSVAVKVLNEDLAATIGPERFAREIELTAGLQHPNIVPVFDSGEAAGALWYTMPFVDGESLRARLRRERQLPIPHVLEIAVHVAEALDYAHARGIVHRDVKPENILLLGTHALIADFGIARATSMAHITQAGLSIGTPQYMSPEQVSGEHAVDGRSDLYALACVVYEMLAGEPPFAGASSQAVAAKHLGAPIPSVRTLRPEVPEAMDTAIRRGLAKAPSSRFSTAGEFAAALAKVNAPKRVVATPAIVAASLAVILVAVLAWGFTRAAVFDGGRPLLLLMDSPHPARVYDASTLAANGTNADAISDILAGLPVRTVKETIGPSWHREDEIRQFAPDLILVHYSGFCQETCHDRTRLAQLIETFARSRTRFLIYSRSREDSLRRGVDSLLRRVDSLHPGTLRRVTTFGLTSHGPPHWRDAITATALKLRVKALLDLR